MSGLFSAPTPPAPPPPAPGQDDAEVRDAALQERLRRARTRGRTANILTGGRGVEAPLQAARKRLLGE